jgi:hypothetical protein
MFIRQTRTNNKITGEGYFTFRLVRGERIGGKVRQITVLNLGRNFSTKQDDWPLLCRRIEQLLQPQDLLLAIDCPETLERLAQRLVGQLVVRASVPADATEITPAPLSPEFQELDIDSLQQTQPRSVGVEHVALHALSQLGLVKQFADLGINGVTRAAILGNLIGRMAQPASELATWHWLQSQSALGELIDTDFNAMSHMALYRASDVLMRHRETIESKHPAAPSIIFRSTRSIFRFSSGERDGQKSGAGSLLARAR